MHNHVMPNTESVLMFPKDPSAGFARAALGITDVFRRSSVTVQVRLITDTDIVFGVGGLTLSVGRTKTPVQTSRYGTARRPANALADAPELAGLLAGQSNAITVRVSGPPTAARSDTRLALCYIATSLFLADATPSLIYWSHSDCLYTLAEFKATERNSVKTPSDASNAPPQPVANPARSRPKHSVARISLAPTHETVGGRTYSARPPHQPLLETA